MSGGSIKIPVNATLEVSGLFLCQPEARACFVMAHGAGAGMAHPFLAGMAKDLAESGIATLRYQFPYMERGSKRPDKPEVAQATARAAVIEAGRLAPHLPLFAGGKSFGGRMTSQAQAAAPLAQVRGLIFLGFPLHPPGKHSDERGQHLLNVRIPMLFLQGTRDDFADMELLQPLVQRLGTLATLKTFQDADHSFHVPARSGRKDSDIKAALLEAMVEWVGRVISGK